MKGVYFTVVPRGMTSLRYVVCKCSIPIAHVIHRCLWNVCRIFNRSSLDYRGFAIGVANGGACHATHFL